MACLIDTAVFIAAYFPKEVHHQDAKEIITAIQTQQVRRALITDYILDETVTFIRKKTGAEVSNIVLDTLLGSPNLDLLKVNKKHFEAGIAFFKRYDQLSFTDATTVAVMKDKGINLIYSFDSDFDTVPEIVRMVKPLV
ncbi:MAG: type II toxin-antitoxin system VapC family toxin [Candidatus Bathyarchaeia archaeon]